jgi:hypothetical protein
MKRNKKLAILIVLMTGAVLIWAPKGKKAHDAPPAAASAFLDHAVPLTRLVTRKRTEFVDWGRDPFAKPQIEEKKENNTGSVSDLKLDAIMWDDKASAFINNSMVSVGDKIADKTVKRIEQNRVILTDGTKNYVLELQE